MYQKSKQLNRMLSTDIGKVAGVKSQHCLNGDVAVFDDGAKNGVHKTQGTTPAGSGMNGAVAGASIVRVVD